MTSREELNLQKIIDQYQIENTEKQRLEKELKSKNSFIKSKLAELGKQIYETTKSKATITYQNKVSMNEEKVIEILRENCKKKDLTSVIKTKEYIDYDALESLIYNGGISADKLEPANTTTVTTTLRVVPKKEEKKDE